MLLSLAVSVMVSSAPSPEPVHLSLSSLPSARLIAQAPPLPPPMPSLQPQGVSASGQTASQIQAEIDGINDQLRGLKTDWPTISVVLAYLGWSISPIALVGLLFIAIGSALPAGGGIVAVLGVALLVIGLAGVAMGIIGIATGITASNAAKTERDELIQKRQALERDLRQLRSSRIDSDFETSPRMITVAVF